MKGIILAGGFGTRLYPITTAISKQLLPVYDKPMIYYPLSVLMLANIRDILIITTIDDAVLFKKMLGDGSTFGINLQYAIQEKPNGLAEAFIIGKDFLQGDDVCLILGDNIFYGSGFSNILRSIKKYYDHSSIDSTNLSAKVFGYYVNDPSRYGVVELNGNDIISIEEKPKIPKSNYVIPGLYFYPADVVNKVYGITPSARGELEITALNQTYLDENRLQIEILPRGFAWLDTGTFDSLSEASNYVETIEKRTNLQIACLEEIGYMNAWLTIEDLRRRVQLLGDNSYKDYILSIIKREDR
jgi:glucose-1-phosphate thymidylyltransferase